MPRKPQMNTASNAAVPESGPAVDNVRTVREAEAIAAARDAEEKRAKASRTENSETRGSGSNPKLQGDTFASPSREANDEPVVTDEP